MSNSLKMVVVLTVISALAALILAGMNIATKDRIAEAERQDFLRGLTSVLPGFDNEPDRDILTVDGNKLYIGKKGGQVFGYAVESVSAKGYSGNIKVLVGVGTDGKILGIEIISHAETPGLGNKIENEEWRSSFKGMTADSKISVKKDGGDIDGFSGATISPRAVCEAVVNALALVKKADGGAK
ncbi:RnfABCDGE type electron transport complex subunit G [Seleniivibrio woodruffii]|uniref:RnfABCDGE type electron transport complex subunit G n=1 Tax=Seleniivibrio woodruffii TaxID=1078050 RepID=UPI002409776A|nr:RnfABCDGE type electron transport complex subunit G [Seleniivibrio woodruffii]